ncbi:hypothetical protein Taro_036370 [Colocasia esculenta]|uniref:Serine aminopeptidase S33 domain-containing protein n=1 Tax=Colocasia esculenta TaxID=4460 RepID=A0A843WHN7_COLES|nr:hypothetical protein [Colocasia esculenta]
MSQVLKHSVSGGAEDQILPSLATGFINHLLNRRFGLSRNKLGKTKFTRGHTLQCSHYVPATFPENNPLPCVIYCHGNRADANEAAVILLPSNITVFTLDFSGSGLSGGDYVSLGWHEKDDLKVVVSFLRSNKQISCIGLWGRSMGAVTRTKSKLEGRITQYVRVKMAVQYMRRVIQKKAKFDIMDLNASAPKTFIPALFGHAADDVFIQPRHSDLIYKSYAGDKNIIKFEGDHNSPRPQFYYDSVSIFFYNVLHPPQNSSSYSSRLEKYYDLGDLKVGTGMDESLLYEIISGLRAVSTDSASSSSAPSLPKGPSTKSVAELLSESGALTQIKLDATLPDQDGLIAEIGGNDDEDFHLLIGHPEEKGNGQNDECCSYTSSNRESWGRCSSLGGVSEEESSSAECVTNNSRHQVSFSFFIYLFSCPQAIF